MAKCTRKRGLGDGCTKRREAWNDDIVLEQRVLIATPPVPL
jgi:hypothetical protein